MKPHLARIAGLLFLSGLCALVFQVAWFRELRLVFGASTAASAAVLAIFMGGLGLGNAVLGGRADRRRNPLAFYALLELLVALGAAVSPLLIDLIRGIYIATGGQSALSFYGATALRLVLSALVLGLPTVVMGGTLPAAARAVTTDADSRRRRTAVLYGANTLGAVAGAVLSTFFALETFGTRTTLWLACLINLLVSAGAWRLSRRCGAGASPARKSKQDVCSTKDSRQDACSTSAPAGLVYTAAGIVGFAFFLMELVWYRMLGPLLGGSTFTFGLILAVALLGIALGGAAYALLFGRLRATLGGLAFTCGLEAALMAVPLALGDRLALWAARLHDANAAGFAGEVLGWAAVAGVVVLPAALISGLQFPLLIALLGRGQSRVGRQIGLAAAWNTVGAILGSLAGGFGLLPLLTAPGAWRAAVVLLAALSVVLLVVQFRGNGRSAAAILLPAGTIIAAAVLVFLPGPTAVWRHSGIGAGRSRMPAAGTNALRSWQHAERRKMVWEAEGVEAGVAIAVQHGLAFIVNGKSDGNAVADAGTQIMLGLTGAMLHGEPKTALVVGLGTGETAGWLAEVPTMDRVDCVEIEPALDEMARRCSRGNHDVLNHPKVRRIYNDAREVLLTSPGRYDLIVSEPSNPYRSGIAGLFTREFYLAARDRLAEGGLFLQWLQGYEIDEQSVQTVFATLLSVYAEVEVWQTGNNDMLLLASMEPLRHSAAALRERIAQHPYRTALADTWRAQDLEGLLAHYVAGPRLMAEYASAAAACNTDDRNVLEYGFARSLGRRGGFAIHELREAAAATGAHRPPLVEDDYSRLSRSEGRHAVDWDSVERQRWAMYLVLEHKLPPQANLSSDQQAYRRALERYAAGDWRGMTAAWQSQPHQATTATELALLGLAYAQLGDGRALPLVERLLAIQPTEAAAILGILYWREERYAEAVAPFALAFEGLRTDPWPLVDVMDVALAAAVLTAKLDPRQGPALVAALREPFALGYLEDARRRDVCFVATVVSVDTAAECIDAMEPNVPWERSFLRLRQRVYAAAAHPLADRAREDLAEFARRDTGKADGRSD
jgi:spermidine synthase